MVETVIEVFRRMKKLFGSRETVWYGRSTPTTLNPSELRPALHAKIDEMDGETLAILHRVTLELELERLTGDLDAEFDKLRGQGRLDHLHELIREARDAIRARGAV